MKKLVTFAVVLFLCLTTFQSVSAKTEQGVDITPGAESAMLIDAETGKILYEKNAEEKLYPASMTKMMGILLVMEAIRDGRLSWDTQVTASEYASSMGGSQIFLKAGEVMSVEDLMKASCIVSANDAIVALAEKVGASESNFVAMMNKKAEELGLVNTHFANVTGLHDDNHWSCARDMALIGKELIRVGGEDVLRFTRTYDDYIREDTPNKFWLVNTNKMVRTYNGMDGLKTGFTQQSMYCITVTAERDNLRLIGVVMKEPDRNKRNSEAAQLLDYGFSNFSFNTLYEQGQIIQEMEVENGKPNKVNLVAKNKIGHIINKGAEAQTVESSVEILMKKAPLKPGDDVARLTLTFDDGTSIEEMLTVENEILPLDFMDILLRSIRRALF